jgi:hypothetical protein
VFVINLSGKLAAIFACFTLLIVGSVVILNEMSFDYQTVFNAGKYGIVGAIVAGIPGYLIGRIFEKARRK